MVYRMTEKIIKMRAASGGMGNWNVVAASMIRMFQSHPVIAVKLIIPGRKLINLFSVFTLLRTTF
jgi:hypothetical protein